MKRLGKFLIAIGVLLIVVVVVSIIHHFQLCGATEAYIADLRAKGEPMDLAQVMPAPVPPEQNGADALRKADEIFHTNGTLFSSNYYYGGMKKVAPGKAAVVVDQPDLRSYDSTNSWEDVQEAVAQNADAFALLHQIIKKPNFDVGIHYEKGFDDLGYTNLLLPETKAVAMRLGVAALNNLHQEDTASAVENVRATLAIANGMRQERLLISELVRIAIAAIAVPNMWEILQSTNVTDSQLAVLQKDWTDLEFLHGGLNAYEVERVVGNITADKWRRTDSMFAHLVQEPPQWANVPKLTALDRLKLKYRLFRWRYWWSYEDELRQLKGEQLILETFRRAQTNDVLLSIRNELQSDMASLPIPTNDNIYVWFAPMEIDFHFVLSADVPSSAKTFEQVIKMEIERRLVVTATALRRYQLKHREYPAALDTLVPEFLPAVPRDLDGKSLRYRLNADGSFTLYSIGDDGKDDGGDPTPPEERKSSTLWYSGRDWVWPQPATAEEIQKFDNKPPK